VSKDAGAGYGRRRRTKTLTLLRGGGRRAPRRYPPLAKWTLGFSNFQQEKRSSCRCSQKKHQHLQATVVERVKKKKTAGSGRTNTPTCRWCKGCCHRWGGERPPWKSDGWKIETMGCRLDHCSRQEKDRQRNMRGFAQPRARVREEGTRTGRRTRVGEKNGFDNAGGGPQGARTTGAQGDKNGGAPAEFHGHTKWGKRKMRAEEQENVTNGCWGDSAENAAVCAEGGWPRKSKEGRGGKSRRTTQDDAPGNKWIVLRQHQTRVFRTPKGEKSKKGGWARGKTGAGESWGNDGRTRTCRLETAFGRSSTGTGRWLGNGGGKRGIIVRLTKKKPSSLLSGGGGGCKPGGQGSKLLVRVEAP